MKGKKILVVLLSVALLLCTLSMTVFAGKFNRNQSYSGHFNDVKKGVWYEVSVKNAYEYGLMNGSAVDKFNPNGMFTVAEAITVAARMHSIYNGNGSVIPAADGPWYMGAVNYCIKNNIIHELQFNNYTKNTTRSEMVGIMAAALPDDAWKIINNVDTLPDVHMGTPYYDDIMSMYNAGVIGGSDKYGSFQPNAYITRAEVSAIVSRMADETLRQKFSLTPVEAKPITIPDRYDDAFAGESIWSNGTNYYYSPNELGNGLLAVRDRETGLWGYIDIKGNTVIEPKYISAGNFMNGKALVKIDDKHDALIDTKGKVVLLADSISNITNYSYDIGNRLENKEAYVDGKGLAIINKYNEILTPFKYSWVEELKESDKVTAYAFRVSVGDKNGIVDLTGKEVVPCKYYAVYREDNYYRATCGDDYDSGEGYDVYTLDGKFVKHVKEEWEIRVLYLPLWFAQEGNKYALVSSEGKITEAVYDSIDIYGNFAALRVGEMIALAGRNGIILELGNYDIAYTFNDVVAVYFDGYDYFCFVDENGIFSPKFYGDSATIEDIKGDYIFFCARNGLVYYSVYNRKTGEVTSKKDFPAPKYEKLASLGRNEVTLCEEFDGTCYFTVGSSYVLPYYTSPIFTNKKEALAAFEKYFDVVMKPDNEGYGVREENGKPIGIFDGVDENREKYSKTVIQGYMKGIYYDSIVYIGEGYFACKFNETWYLVKA